MNYDPSTTAILLVDPYKSAGLSPEVGGVASVSLRMTQ